MTLYTYKLDQTYLCGFMLFESQFLSVQFDFTNKKKEGTPVFMRKSMENNFETLQKLPLNYLSSHFQAVNYQLFSDSDDPTIFLFNPEMIIKFAPLTLEEEVETLVFKHDFELAFRKLEQSILKLNEHLA